MADEHTNYWKSRRSRRGFLGSATALGAGAAGFALVGCGDDDDSTGGADALKTPTTAAGTSPTAVPANPFANAKRGGIYNIPETGDSPSIDPYGNGSFHVKVQASYVYSRLYKYNAGIGVAVKDLHPVPDIASGSEASPDGVTYTVKLRDGAKFHNVAPVNGHAVTTDDVKASWDRIMDPKVGISGKVSFVDKVEYPDKSTIKFTLKAPSATFLDTLADTNVFFVLPKEADASATGFDPAKVMIGSGPWLFDSYTPSVSYKYKRNPDWYMKGFPLMDGVTASIIPQIPNQIAQFQAGSLDGVGIPIDNLIDLKNNVKGIQLYGEVSQLISFLYMDDDPASPWNKDPRVRLAMSMALDRDGLTELAYQIKKLQSSGINVTGNWNNIIPAGLLKYWLDPKGPNIGDGGKNFQFNVADAKAMMSAAGFADGTPEVTYQYSANAYGTTFNNVAEAQITMLNAIGIKTKTVTQDYNSVYKTQTFSGNFKGIAFGYETPFPEAGGYAASYRPGDANNHSHINDPKLTDLFNKQGSELDATKRKDLFDQIQQYHATKMYYIPSQAGAGTGWTGYSGALQVNNIHTVPGSYGVGTETYPFYWKSS